MCVEIDVAAMWLVLLVSADSLLGQAPAYAWLKLAAYASGGRRSTRIVIAIAIGWLGKCVPLLVRLLRLRRAVRVG